MSAPLRGNLPHAQYERFESARGYAAMLEELIPRAQRVIRIFDKALTPHYNTAAFCGLLRTFLRADPLNRLYVVLHEPDSMLRTCPRFMTVLQQFSHNAGARQTPGWARHVYDAFVIYDANHYLHRFHHQHMRYARGENELAGAKQLLDRFQELWDASTPIAVSRSLGI